jgi:hypothetical protein
LIGDEKKAGILGIELILVVIGSMNSEANRRNGQNHAFSLAKQQVTRIFKEESIDIRDCI